MIDPLRPDCRYFRGDRPCTPHKRQGVQCGDCPCFSRRGARILIIKLDAPGDVLRSTCILPAVKKAFPEAYLVWLTRSESLPLLQRNPYLDEVVRWDDALVLKLAVERFDLVLSLDNSAPGAHAATLANAPEKLGFASNAEGQVVPLNDEAREWYRMGLFDPIKQANHKSYPHILHDICRLPWQGARPILELDERERLFARHFVAQQGLADVPIVGLFTGAGRRWQGKSWPEERFAGLIELLLDKGRAVLLLGGPEEMERNQCLSSRFAGRVVDAGCDHSLREFAALVGCCDSLVTADTLALHVASALGRKFVTLVGPTSAAEIESYGNGLVLQPEEPCRCYYQPQCTQTPSCLETIAPDRVLAALESLS